MRRFNRGRRVRVLPLLAAAAIVALTALYAVVGGAKLDVVLALAAAAGFFSLLWTYARTRRRKDEHLRYHAHHDFLTDLPCRAVFAERVERALGEGGAGAIALMFVDLDDFKEINHSLGYEAGDTLLAVVAERLRAALRPGDLIARLGGDEFTVLLEGVSGREVAVAEARRLLGSLEAPFELEEREILVSASVGVVLGSGSTTAEHLLREANVAMREAKKKGKARYRMFDQGAESSTGGRLVQESEMRRAIQEGEFRVHYQPLVSLRTGRITGVEALARWQHPFYGLIPPAEFIPLAEQTGLITHIGRWVLREACRQVRAWQDEQGESGALTLNVNVSACQLQQPNLVKEVSSALNESGLASRHLRLEITESVVMHEAYAMVPLQRLKSMGIGIALDDFGTGYSSISHFKRFPLDTLKIDRSYIEGLGSDAGDTAIVHATLAFARSLDLTVTAEGIENAEQLFHLRNLGCELGQGYYFAKPLSSDKLEELLTAGLLQPPREEQAI